MSTARTGQGPSARALHATVIALLALGGVAIALRFMHLGSFAPIAAMLVAVMQAALVLLVFMEFGYEKPTVRLAFGAGMSLLALLIVLLVADVVTRSVPPLGNPPGTSQRAFG